MIRRSTILLVLLLACLLLPVHAVQAQDPAPGPAPVPVPVPTPSPSAAPVSDLPVVGPPTITFATFQQVVQQHNSPMLQEAQAIYDQFVTAGIDPAFGLAIAQQEATFATAPTWAGRKPDGSTTYNWGNVRCGGYSRCYNGWREYTSFAAATADWLGVMQRGYISQGLTTVATILPKYAPAVENDTPGYIRQMIQAMQQWAQGQIEPMPPSTGGGIFDIDKWTRAPLEGYTYEQLRLLTIGVWQGNLTTLRSTETVLNLQTTLVPTLDNVFAELGRVLQPLAGSLLALGVVLAGVGILLTPLFARQDLINLRAVPVLALIIFGAFPLAGAIFVGVEGARRGLADALFTTLFAAADDALRGDQPPGTGADLGELTPLFGAPGDARHAVDVAAAYLMVTPDDLARDDVLPTRFADTFFPLTSADVGVQGQAERAPILSTATRGVTRMTSGIALSTLGQIEAAIHAVFTAGQGLLMLGLLLALTAAVVSPLLRLVDALRSELIQLVFWSWIVSGVQAFGLAFLFSTAASGTATDVLGTALLLLVLEVVLLLGTLWLVGSACWQGVQAARTYRPVAGAGTLVDRLRHVLPVPHPLPTPSAPVSAGGMRAALVNYRAARSFGARPEAALAYAAAPSPRVQRATAAALIAGTLPRDVERAILVGSNPRLGDPLSLRRLVAAREALRPDPPAPPRRWPQHPQAGTRPQPPSPVQPRRRGRSHHAPAVQAALRKRRQQKKGVGV